MLNDLTRRFGVPLLTVLVAGFVPGEARAAEGWLTDSERKFFQALGADAVVDGQPVKLGTDYLHLPWIAKEAEPSLRESIEAIAEAREKMRITKGDREQLIAIQRAVAAELKIGVPIAFAFMVLGEEPWDASRNFTEAMLQRGRIVDLWDLKASWIERGLNAEAQADAALGQITDALEKRLGPRNDAIDLSFDVIFDNRQFKISGKAGQLAVKEPIVQIRLHKKIPDGKWIGMSIASAMLLRAMGIESMNFETAFQAGRLAAVQELAMSRPMVRSQLLPTISEGKPVSLRFNLSPAEVACLERVELRVWSESGWFTIDSLPGLDLTKKNALKAAERDLSDRLIRSRQKLSKLEVEARNGKINAIIDNMVNQTILEAQRQNKQRLDNEAADFRRRMNNGRP